MNRITKDLTYLLLGLFIGIGIRGAMSTDIRVEALGGSCQYSAVGNTIWYQEQYPTELTMRDGGCLFIGLSSVPRNQGTMHLGWRVGYTDFGQANAYGIYSLHDSEAYLHLDGRSCDPVSRHGCLGKGFGVQTAKGFTFGGVVEWDTPLKGMTVGAELGGFLYEGRWTVVIDSYPDASVLPQMYADWKGWQVTPYIGGTLRYGWLMAMARAYGRVKANEHGCEGCSGVANGKGTQVLVGISVPIK